MKLREVKINPSKRKDWEEKSYFCTHCGNGIMRRHLKYDKKIRVGTEIYLWKSWVCDNCKWMSWQSIEGNAKIIKDKYLFLCMICGDGFTTFKHLKLHMGIHHPNNFKEYSVLIFNPSRRDKGRFG